MSINPAYVFEGLLPSDIIKYELTKYNLSERQERQEFIKINKDNYYEKILPNIDIILDEFRFWSYTVDHDESEFSMDEFYRNAFKTLVFFRTEIIKYKREGVDIQKAILCSNKIKRDINDQLIGLCNNTDIWLEEWNDLYETLIFGGITIYEIRISSTTDCGGGKDAPKPDRWGWGNPSRNEGISMDVTINNINILNDDLY
jgi:hypothetical protein